MLRRAVLMCVILAVGIGLAAWLVPGIEVEGGFLTYLWLGLLFGLVNAVLGTILHIISLPLTIMTFGLFALVVNGVVLAATAGLSDQLDVGGFLGTIVGALIISIVTAVLWFFLRPKDDEEVA
jgi:putative membrane protein